VLIISKKLLQLAEKQVVFVAEVQIKSRTPYRGAVQHFLHRHVIDGFFLNQRHQCAAQPLVRTPDALIDLAPLHDSMFSQLVRFLQLGLHVPGHLPPLCSATQNGPRRRGLLPLHCPIIG